MKRTAFILAAVCSAALVTGCAGWRDGRDPSGTMGNSATSTTGSNTLPDKNRTGMGSGPGTMAPSGTTGPSSGENAPSR